MSPNRYQEVKRIFAAAAELNPASRSGYLADACGGDESLRREVESLLACRTEGREFFSTSFRDSPDLSGREVSHYILNEKIGEGGMGVVYQARDTHLDRYVALKILPPEAVLDPERNRRFVREAKAASALNHPNIVVIHDIDSADGLTFIAMELVKGKTLDRVIGGRGLPVSQMLKYSVQIADALAAAHRAGIIHRDIKPANIMIADSGPVKVLDFGLAKLVAPEEGCASEPTRTAGPRTGVGIILGTVAYMSPEQAQGKPLDARSDIFSLGSVLYEMITGCRAFARQTHAATLAAIVSEEPTPILMVAPETPRELDRVISRCLRKDPERRFQDIADLKVALEELKEESDPGTVVRRAGTTRRWSWVAGIGLLLALLSAGLWFGLRSRRAAGAAPYVRTFTGLPGAKSAPAISPDGKQLAFCWKNANRDNFDIYVQLVDEPVPRRLTTDPATERNPAWSPDGLRIAFLRDTPSGADVIVVPAAGGVEHRLCTTGVRDEFWVRSGLAWSPDGKSLAIVDRDLERSASSIYLLDIETREKRRLTTPPRDGWDALPAFSPDGLSLAFTRGADRPLCDIYVMRLAERGDSQAQPRRITHDNTFIFGMDWTADSRGLAFSSTRGGMFALWRASAAGGEPQRMPVGGNNAFFPSISRTGSRFAYSEGTADWNVWRVAARDRAAREGPSAGPTRISFSPQVDGEPAFSPDSGKIAWASMHSGSHQIWIANSDGSQPVQLTRLDPPGASSPRWSPDAKLIAFTGYSRGPYRVNVIPAEGGAPHRVTTGDFNEDAHSWSHDGKWIYFVSNRGDGKAIWKAPAGGGSPVFLARGVWGPVESLDGAFVYYSGPENSIWKVPASGGSPVVVGRNGLAPIATDGRFVYYTGAGATIWKAPVSAGEATPILTIGQRASWSLGPRGIYVLDPDGQSGPEIQWFGFGIRRPDVVKLPGKPDTYTQDILYDQSVSPDGRWVAYVHVDRTESDIMLVENFR